MVEGVSQSSGSGLFDMLRSMQKEQEGLPDATSVETLSAQTLETVSAPSVAAYASTPDLMSGNFASAAGEESRYIKATKTALQSGRNMVNQQNAILSAGMAALDAMDSNNYAVRVLNGKKAAERMLQEQQHSTSEASQKNLKDLKEDIEKRADDAAAPTDANGRTVEGLPAESAGQSAPAPDTSTSASPPPAPAAAATPAAEVTATPTPAPEVSVQAAPSTPTINITV